MHIPNYISSTSFSLNRNYVASDLKAGQMLPNQVHEVGHSIAQLLGLAKPGSEDPYAGRLQDCFNNLSVGKKP